MGMSLVGSHENGVLGIAYSQAYRYLCSIGYESAAYLWVTNMRQHKMPLIDHSTPHKATFSGVLAVPDSPEILTADAKGYVKLWDVRTFKCVQTFLMGWSPKEAYPPPVAHFSLCYAAATNTLVTTDRRRVCLHDQLDATGDGKSDGEGVSLVLYNGTQKAFLTVSGRDLKIWELSQGCLTAHLTNVTNSDITCMTQDDYGRRIYLGTQDGSLTCRIFHTAELLYDYDTDSRHAGEVLSIVYYSNRDALVSSAADGTVLYHSNKDAGKGCINLTLSLKQELIAENLRTAVSPALALLAIAGSRIVLFRDLTNPKRPLSELDLRPSGTSWSLLASDGNPPHPSQIRKSEIVSLSFLGSRPVLAVSLSCGRILLFSTRPLSRMMETSGGRTDGAPVMLIRWGNSLPWHHQLAAGRRQIASALQDGVMLEKKREVHDERPRESIARNSAEMQSVEESPNKVSTPLLATRPLRSSPESAEVQNKAASRVVLNHAEAERQWLSRKRECFQYQARHPAVGCLAYDEASCILWTGDALGYVGAWDLSVPFDFYGLIPMTYPVRLNPDGTMPPSVFVDSKKVLSSDTVDNVPVLRSWRAHHDDVVSLSFHPPTGNLITSGGDRRVLIWHATGILLSELAYSVRYSVYNACDGMFEPEPVLSPGEEGSVLSPKLLSQAVLLEDNPPGTCSRPVTRALLMEHVGKEPGNALKILRSLEMDSKWGYREMRENDVLETLAVASEAGLRRAVAGSADPFAPASVLSSLRNTHVVAKSLFEPSTVTCPPGTLTGEQQIVNTLQTLADHYLGVCEMMAAPDSPDSGPREKTQQRTSRIGFDGAKKSDLKEKGSFDWGDDLVDAVGGRVGALATAFRQRLSHAEELHEKVSERQFEDAEGRHETSLDLQWVSRRKGDPLVALQSELRNRARERAHSRAWWSVIKKDSKTGAGKKHDVLYQSSATAIPFRRQNTVPLPAKTPSAFPPPAPKAVLCFRLRNIRDGNENSTATVCLPVFESLTGVLAVFTLASAVVACCCVKSKLTAAHKAKHNEKTSFSREGFSPAFVDPRCAVQTGTVTVVRGQGIPVDNADSDAEMRAESNSACRRLFGAKENREIVAELQTSGNATGSSVRRRVGKSKQVIEQWLQDSATCGVAKGISSAGSRIYSVPPQAILSATSRACAEKQGVCLTHRGHIEPVRSARPSTARPQRLPAVGDVFAGAKCRHHEKNIHPRKRPATSLKAWPATSAYLAATLVPQPPEQIDAFGARPLSARPQTALIAQRCSFFARDDG
ncbi:hypothetical protein DIPPA_64313 [Diplonema papillatum]|nr:hypothetical protein DIPPA_64313 [Diplonema papillatum]